MGIGAVLFATLLNLITCKKVKPFVWFALTVQTSFLWNYFLRIILENFMDMLFTNLLRLYREP